MDIQSFFIRYAIYIVITSLLLRVIYFRSTPNREVFIGMFMFGNGVYLITVLLQGVDMSMGVAFGLFAVFSMLRYRTDTLHMRDMTYLFTTIVLALMCAVADINYLQMQILGLSVIALAAIAETQFFSPGIIERMITYDRIDKIHPDLHDELMEEIHERTGMKIVKVELGKIDFLNDSAQVILFCEE